MLKQAVVFSASTVIIAGLALILAVLARLSWGPNPDGPTPSSGQVPSGADKVLRKA